MIHYIFLKKHIEFLHFIFKNTAINKFIFLADNAIASKFKNIKYFNFENNNQDNFKKHTIFNFFLKNNIKTIEAFYDCFDFFFVFSKNKFILKKLSNSKFSNKIIILSECNTKLNKFLFQVPCLFSFKFAIFFFFFFLFI